MYQKLILNCLSEPYVQNRVLVQRSMPLLCETLYRLHADASPLFCWSLAPHPLPSACHRDSGEWIHSKGSQQSLVLNWTLHELGPTARSMHQKYKQFLLAALLCVSWRLLWSTTPASSCISWSIWLCLLLKISSNWDSESSAGSETLIVVLSFYKMDEETVMWIRLWGKMEFLDGITEIMDYV